MTRLLWCVAMILLALCCAVPASAWFSHGGAVPGVPLFTDNSGDLFTDNNGNLLEAE